MSKNIEVSASSLKFGYFLVCAYFYISDMKNGLLRKRRGWKKSAKSGASATSKAGSTHAQSAILSWSGRRWARGAKSKLRIFRLMLRHQSSKKRRSPFFRSKSRSSWPLLDVTKLGLYFLEKILTLSFISKFKILNF